jgi:hypothetical protein
VAAAERRSPNAVYVVALNDALAVFGSKCLRWISGRYQLLAQSRPYESNALQQWSGSSLQGTLCDESLDLIQIQGPGFECS